MSKIQETKNGLFVYLPKNFTQLLAWKKGDVLSIYPDNQNKQTLIMKKVMEAESKPQPTNNIVINNTPHTQTFTPKPQIRIDPETIRKFQYMQR